MKGLLRNNFYAAITNAKAFTLIMILSGILIVTIETKTPSLIIGYMLLGMVGFSLNSAASLRIEGAAKWNKYKLSLPVKKSSIIKSYYLSLLLWLFIGTLFAGVMVTFFILFHGFPFFRVTDVYMLFVVGIGISLFMGSFFFPLFFWDGEERNEVFLALSLLCGTGMVMGIITFINTLFPSPMNTAQTMIGGMIILACALCVFFLSIPLTIGIFRHREY